MNKTTKNSLKIILTLVFVLGLSRSTSQTSTINKKISDQRRESVNLLFEPWNTQETPGAAIAVLKDGAIIYKNAFGSANLENCVANTTASVFNIASNSKQFAAFAMLLLADQKKISLDDNIRKYLPELPDFGTTIKVKNLAQHTHGIRGITYLLGMAGWNIEDVITKKSVFKLLSQQKELNFFPETDFSYNNSGYILLAEIIERVSGKSFHEYIKDTILTPLEMDHTVLQEDNEKVILNLSNPYFFDGSLYKKGIRNSKDIVGPTGIRTSIEDLSKWVLNFENLKVGNQEILDRLLTPAVLKNGDTLSYAYGLVASNYKGHKVIGHGGADAGYRSQTLHFPKERLSVIVLTNNGSLNAEEKAYDIADIYLDENSINQILKERTENKTLSIVTKETLKKYEGKFELQPGFILEFNQNEGALSITATGQGTLPLETLSDSQFRIRRISAIITFIENENEEVNSLIFDHDGNKSKGNRLIFKIDESNLKKYSGIYYSDELKTYYTLSVEDGGLIARHERQEETHLTAIEDYKFTGDTWFFGILDFSIDDKKINGFRVTSDRVKNLWFKKIKPFDL